MVSRSARYEVRDAVHGFVQFNAFERDLLNSMALQRLRTIKQLAFASQLYPGAMHTRLEHSLGVMELASRAFDTVVLEAPGSVRRAMGWSSRGEIARQRQVVRLAGLLHDVGHPPFSHAGERDLCPPERPSHEHYTHDLIADPGGDIRQLLEHSAAYGVPVTVEDVLAVAVPGLAQPRAPYQFVLAALVSGRLDVDRIDYLVRHSHHTGVAYGLVDCLRLLNTLRVVERPDTGEPALALERGGVQTAEGLLLARHYMFAQVYQHRVTQIYDLHLKEYTAWWLPNGTFPKDLREYLAITDAAIEAACFADAANPASPRHALARRLFGRQHFRLVAEVRPAHLRAEPNVFERLRRDVAERFGAGAVRFTELRTKEVSLAEFFVLDGRRVRPISEFSDVFLTVRPAWEGRIYCDPTVTDLRWRVAEFCRRRLPRLPSSEPPAPPPEARPSTGQ